MPRILIVDDEELLRNTIADILIDEGYEVIEAQNGVEGLVLLQENNDIHIILSDVVMPALDGLAFLREVNRNYPTISVIMLTGHGEIQDAVQAMREGALNYLLKPIQRQQILESIHEALELHISRQKRQTIMDQVVTGLQQLGVGGHVLAEHLHETVSKIRQDRFLRIRQLVIDQHRLVASFNGKPFDLTPTEFGILYCLAQANGKVVSFEDIVLQVQGIQLDRDEARSMISTHLSNLRTKMRDAGCENYLVNSRGYGYFISIEGS